MRRVRLLLVILLPPALFVLLAAADCTRTYTGLIPLTELGAALYKGAQGGLYPGGSNTRPAAHDAAGMRFAAEVVSRNTAGLPDPQNGKIVLLSIGMSNTTQEFQAFMSKANADPDKNPRVLLVDGAQGGQTAYIISDLQGRGLTFWSNVDQRIAQAQATAAQVQAVWLKEADAGPTKPFPEHARLLQSELQIVAQILRSKFPNLKLVYLSSRTYGGYANNLSNPDLTNKLNPEPYAYEGGFAVKWLIEQQINGDPELSYDGGKAAWMAWGPDLWADGLRMRADGLTYACSDFANDYTHPSQPYGRDKVANLLLNFLKSEPTARSWFVKPASAPPTARPAALVNAASFDSTLAPRALVSLYGTDLAPGEKWSPALPLPGALTDVTVEINGAPCPLLYVSPVQINFLLPVGTVSGDLRVRRAGVLSDPLPVTVGAQAPAVFGMTYETLPPAAARHAGGGPIVSQAAPAARGETIELYVTGLGTIDYTNWQAATPPTVTIAGRDATVTWAGPAPGFAGLDQVNVTIPAASPIGKQTLQIRSGTLTSAPVSIFID